MVILLHRVGILKSSKDNSGAKGVSIIKDIFSFTAFRLAYYSEKSVWLVLQILYFNFKLLTSHIDKY